MIHAVGTALGEIIRNLRRTVRLTLYENRSRRAGMLLGRWWDLLSPLLQILIYWFVFSVGLGTQEKNGFPYHLWLMCGMMPWLALNSAILGASASIQQAASIIRNVRIPLSIIPMKAVVRAYYEHLWTMAILLIALLLGGVPVTWHYLELAYYLAASWVLLIGAALLTSSLTAVFCDFGELLQPLMRLLFYVSSVAGLAARDAAEPAGLHHRGLPQVPAVWRRLLVIAGAGGVLLAGGAGAAGGGLHAAYAAQKPLHRPAVINRKKSRRKGAMLLADVIVRCRELTKVYDLYGEEKDRLKALLGLRANVKKFPALRGVTQDFHRGEIVGLAGLNGSGKSTLARIIAGITQPDLGLCEVSGTVSMLAANIGMNDQLTGRENIAYKCMLMGMEKREIAQIQQQIIDFADVGVYIDQPLRTYSSGMRSRLGFAISAHMNPEILIVDEALSVGDASFAEKCMARMRHFRAEGKTIFFVTHAPWQMLNFCDRVMWLHQGRVVGYDTAERMIPAYVAFTREWTQLDHLQRTQLAPDYETYRAQVENQQRAVWQQRAKETAQKSP